MEEEVEIKEQQEQANKNISEICKKMEEDNNENESLEGGYLKWKHN